MRKLNKIHACPEALCFSMMFPKSSHYSGGMYEPQKYISVAIFNTVWPGFSCLPQLIRINHGYTTTLPYRKTTFFTTENCPIAYSVFRKIL